MDKFRVKGLSARVALHKYKYTNTNTSVVKGYPARVAVDAADAEASSVNVPHLDNNHNLIQPTIWTNLGI